MIDPMPPPYGANATPKVPTFYSADTYRAEESVGYLMRRIRSAMLCSAS